jgi:HEAT repeat protein
MVRPRRNLVTLRPRWRTSAALSSILVTGVVSGIAPAAAAQDSPPSRDLGSEVSLSIRYHREHLNHPTDSDLRALGARYLLEMRLPEATTALDEALRSGRPEVTTAVIASIDASGIAPAELIDALALALNTMPPEQTESIARALALYGEAGSQKVAELAVNAAHNHQVRLGAVQALGELRDPETVRNSVDALIQIIQRDDTESPEVKNAAFVSLDRLTSLSRFGRDVKAWTDWWLRTRAKPLSEWLPDEFQRINDRLDAVQRQLNDARTENEAFRMKLEELMGEVYFLLKDKSVTEMNAKLAAWLGDRTPAVRRIALSRVESRAGNGEMPSTEVTVALVDRLKDADAELRRRSARLLDRVRYDETGPLVAEALAVESNLETRLAFLEILRTRPTSSAVPTLMTLVTDPATRDASAAALNEVVRSGRLSEEYRPAVLEAARAAFAAGATVPAVRLLAAVGEQADIDAIVPLLDHASADIRSAAAESLRPVTSAEAALVGHAGDPAVFPWVVDLLSSGPASAAQLSALLALTPPDEALRQRWRDGLLRLSARVPPAELGAVDAALAAVPSEAMPADAALALREQALSIVLTLPPDSLPVESRETLMRTLARLRSDLNQPEAALAVLDRIQVLTNGNGAATQPDGSSGSATPAPEAADLRGLRFLCLVRLRRFEDAAAVANEPTQWLATMQSVIDTDMALAALLREQIEARYGPQLAEDQRAQLAALAARLPQPDGGGGEPGDGSAGGAAGTTENGAGSGGNRGV